MQLGNPLSMYVTSSFPSANDCVLFALVKLAFVALLPGTVWVYGSSPIFNFRAVKTIMRKGRRHRFG